MAGLLDQFSSFVKTPEGQGLLSAAFGGLAGARRGQPINSLGRAGLAGLAGYSGAQDRVQQAEENAVQKQFREMQMGQMRTQMDRDKGQQEWRAGLPGLLQPKPQEIDQFTGTTQMAQPDPQALQNYAMQPNSPFADDILKRQLFPKTDEPFTLGEGQVRYGAGGKIVAQGPAKVESMPSAIKEYEYAQGQGYRGSFEQFQMAQKRAGASSVNVNTKQETEEAKTVGKFFGDDYATVQKSGFSAQSNINRLGRLEQLLDGVDTGKFAPLGLEVAKAAKAAGLNIDDNLSNKEAAVALSSEIALQLRNPSGGAGMPGAMSDADRTFLAGMVPGIEKTPEGRKLIIETGKKLAKRDIDVAKLAREYRKQNGSIDEGFYDGLSEYSAKNPLFKAPTSPKAPAGPFADPGKEQRYQQWRESQKRGVQ